MKRDPEARPASALRNPFVTHASVLFALTAGSMLAWQIIQPEPELQLGDYVALHGFLETCAIVLSVLVFIVARELHGEQQNRNIVIIGSAFLGVALLDFQHTFSTQGMPSLVTPAGPSTAINFWLAARLLGAIALVYVAWAEWNRYVPLKQIRTTGRLARSDWPR